MSPRSPLLLFVCMVVVGAHDEPADAAPQRGRLTPSAWTGSQSAAGRLLPVYQRLWRLVQELRRPAAAPGDITRPWRIDWPAGARNDAVIWGPAVNTVGVRPIAGRPARSGLAPRPERCVQLCGSEMTDAIQTLCHGRRRRNSRAVSARSLRSSRPHNGTSAVDRADCGMHESAAHAGNAVNTYHIGGLII